MSGNPGASTAAPATLTAARRSPGRFKAERQRDTSARLERFQSLAGGLRGQREEDRVGEAAEYQEPAGLPEQPAERQPVERVEDESSWRTGARAEQDEEECRGRGGDAKTRPAGCPPD